MIIGFGFMGLWSFNSTYNNRSIGGGGGGGTITGNSRVDLQIPQLNV